ncbi:hypothetical protein [Dokdonella sp.]|uniref:hypothetical protein n=1 Tax=Dokdonella sp. TaxID=2291710 RepID=UPI002F3F1E68
MRRPSTQITLLSLLAVALAPAAGARSLSIDAARVANAYVDARGVHLRLAPVPGGALALVVDALSSATLGLEGRLEWSCTLRRAEDDALACAGPVVLQSGRDTASAGLRVRATAERFELELEQGERSVAIELPLAGDGAALARARRVPATWLKAPLAMVWKGGDVREGIFDAQAEWRHDGEVEAAYVADRVTLGTFDGSFAVDGIAVRGTLATSTTAQARNVKSDMQIGGGTLQAGSLRFAFPDAPVAVGFDARIVDDGPWVVERFAWRDPGALEFDAHGEFEPAATVPLRALSVTAARVVFPAATRRYAGDVLAAHGVGGLALDGSVTGRVEVDRDGLRHLAMATDGLSLRDPARTIAVDGLSGGFDWTARGEGVPTALAWRKASIGGVAIGPTRATWQARDGALELRGALRAALLGGHITLERTALRPFASAGERVRTRFALRDLGFERADGAVAAAHVAAEGTVRVDVDADVPRIRVDARIRGGEALVDAFYLKFPVTPVSLAADLVVAADRWRLERFDWNDPDVLAFAASGEFAPHAVPPVQAARIELHDARLAPALQRYARSWLATRGYAELAASGRVEGRLELDRGKPRQFAFGAHDVSIRDGGGRFAVDGLDGAVDWALSADRPATTFGWRSFDVFRLPFGAARAELVSRDGTIALARPLAVDVLGGQMRIERFTAQPRSARGERYAGSFALGGIDMAHLSDLFGWPRFPGKLSGGIPEIEFVGDRVEFRGGLDLYAFDGHLGISGLALERPFGVAPSLSADAHFENLDLEQVTSAFSFGGMSGRLFGTIGGVRLVDWSPVAFDAWLRTDGGGRMSYKAVDDLTALGGGGGLSSNLQTMALKIFDTFGYRRLGIRCILRDDVCSMGGIEPIPPAIVAGAESSSAGYTIVEGSGLPRIMIVGHRRRVDWPTLVRRLVEATRGSGPVIE